MGRMKTDPIVDSLIAHRAAQIRARSAQSPQVRKSAGGDWYFRGQCPDCQSLTFCHPYAPLTVDTPAGTIEAYCEDCGCLRTYEAIAHGSQVRAVLVPWLE